VQPLEGGRKDDGNRTHEEVVQDFPLNEDIKRDGLSDNTQPFKSNRKWRTEMLT